jgi:putative flippase GtrA
MYLAKMTPEISNVTGYAVGLVASYTLNRTYTFKSQQSRRSELIRFLIVFAVAYGLNFVALLILIHKLGLNSGLSQVLAGVVYVGISFIMNKYYVFKSMDEGKSATRCSSWKNRLLATQSLTIQESSRNNFFKETGHSYRVLLYVFCGFSVFYVLFFSTVVFGGREFGSDGQYAAFYSNLTLWSDTLAGGWPAAADLTQMMFSPMRHLFRYLPQGFNLFIVSSYVLISTFMFGYVYEITKSHFAGIVSGLVVGLSGFMMAHLGHTGIISGAAWTPLLIWALEKLRHGYKPLWLGVGAISVCTMLLAGHPQITAYSYLLGGFYALILGIDAKQGKWRYWLVVTAVFFLGIGLSAFQWLLTYELSKETFRSTFSYIEFTAFSLPLEQIFMLYFPFLFGSRYGIFFGEHYWGAPSYTELAGFAGTTGFMLTVVAVVAHRNRLTLFWGLVAIISVMLALGDSLPWLARIIYHVPILNKFRVPGRHIYEFVIAISVLSGLGMAALQQNKIDKVGLIKVTKNLVLFFLIITIIGILIYSKQAPNTLNPTFTLKLFSIPVSPVIYVQILWMVLSILILFFYANDKLGAKKEWLVLCMVMFEMASFGWFHEWRNDGFRPSALWHEEIVFDYNSLVEKSQQKLVSKKSEVIPSDAGRIAGIHSLNWYGPLLLKRFSETTGVNTSGQLSAASLSEKDVGLDIFGGRYLFIEDKEKMQQQGISWDIERLGIDIGNGCGLKVPVDQHMIYLQVPVSANKLAIVSQMNCSVNLTNGEPVANLILHSVDGQKQTVVLRAGIDISESAADCQDVSPLMHHRMATIFQSTPVVRAGLSTCNSNTYFTQASFTKRNIAKVEIKLLSNVRLNVLHMNLFDNDTGSTYPISNLSESLRSKRWHYLQSADGVSVYENMRTMPVAWLVHEAITLSPEQMQVAIHTSILPDGRKFYPANQVLVDKDIVDISSSSRNVKDNVRVSKVDDSNWEINTQSEKPSLLVIGQNYYPGWQATVDDIEVELLRANYTQQGIQLPLGNHKIILEYRPVIFIWGLAISGISLIVLLYLFWRRPANRLE